MLSCKKSENETREGRSKAVPAGNPFLVGENPPPSPMEVLPCIEDYVPNTCSFFGETDIRCERIGEMPIPPARADPAVGAPELSGTEEIDVPPAG